MSAPLLRQLTAVAAALLLMSGSSWARLLRGDEPSAQSNNGRFFAEPSASGRGPMRSTEVFRVLGPKKSEKIWEKPGWSSEAFLSDDGEYLVANDSCSGVLPADHTMDSEIAVFYRRSTPVRVLRLRDVFVDLKRLRGRIWGLCRGFLGDSHRFAIDTWELRRLVFDVSTGKLVETLPIRDIPNVD